MDGFISSSNSNAFGDSLQLIILVTQIVEDLKKSFLVLGPRLNFINKHD